MITSIVELPNFMSRGLTKTMPSKMPICYGFSQAHVDGDGLYLTFDATITEGRDLLVDNMWKYKLTVVPMVSTGMRLPTFLPKWEVFVVTTSPLDTNHMFSPNVPIYPVYMRNHRGEVFLNTPAINNLFRNTGSVSVHETGDTTVLSTERFINMMKYSVGSIENKVADEVLYADWSPIGRKDTLICLMNSIGIEDFEKVFGYNVYEIQKTSIPLEIAQIANAQSSFELEVLLNREAMATDEIADAVNRSKVTWDDVYDSLHGRGCMLECVSDGSVSSLPGGVHLMGTFMDLLYSTPGEDFWFDITVDPAAVHDVYYKQVGVHSGFGTNQVRVKSGLDTSSYMSAAMMLPSRFPAMSQLTAHRTCLDELVLYYKTDLTTPVLWIDMVWWTLATAPGLINATNAAYVT